MPDELSTEQAKSMIDALATMKVFSINFSGGEPLVRPDIVELLEYTSEKNMAMDLLTNGALITEGVIESLGNTNIFNVQVSLDGLRRTHDDFRGVDGAFEAALRGLDHLVDAGYENSQVIMCVHRGNVDQMADVVQLAVDHGAGSVKFSPVTNRKFGHVT